jgi:spermidine synthase
LYKVESLYGRLKVVEENGISRYLIMDGTNQGGVNTENGLSINLYTYAVDALADMMRPDMKTALVLGLGPGVLPNAFSKRSISTDVVEIDPKMAELYERYFAKFGARERVNLFIEDGRRFLKDRSGKKYDIVIMDIFLGDNSPWHLLTLEAFEDVKKVLADKGGVVINFIALPKDAGGARIIRSIHKTLKRVFPHAVVFNHSGFLGDGPQNIFFAASLADGVFELKTTMPIIPPAFIEPIEKILLDKAESFEGDAFLLTDDYNPVEFYTAKSREKWRRSIMALPAKDIMLN